MTRFFNFAVLMLLAGTAVWLAPTAKADEWDKKTILTFSDPVEIPGQVLTPGTYVFKLADTINRSIVNVYTEDEQHLVATIMAVPAYRVEPAGKTIVTFEERAGGSPQALHEWFYPGDNNGIEFVYGKARTQFAVAQTEPAPAPAPVQTAAPVPLPVAEPLQQEQAQPATSEQPVIVREEEIIIAQAISPAPLDNGPQSAPTTLPQTASNFALIPLAGLVLLSAGLAALRFATRQI